MYAMFAWRTSSGQCAYPSKSAFMPLIMRMYFMPACSCSLLAPQWRVLVL